ncbi:hypothetical protein BKA61DRAFT_631473 [Leptodontidium sp. MPI-SDFR-AT-0119]|nr:hypothetical protein BKA61DRAFT_631473 [Leptodontidium sp. MPI-SDFR-AT-0119]
MAPQAADSFSPTAAQQESELQVFIDSIDPSKVCSLASRHNGFKPCRIFQEIVNGSYNVRFFVEFDDSVKWVVRIPSESSVHNAWDKVQSDVATIRYLEANTTIPVPRIHAFGRGGCVDENNPAGHTFIIQGYISGRSLDISAFRKEPRERRKYFYGQLVDILAQLRQQEFDHAGSLMPGSDGGDTPVVGPLLSIQLNDLQLETRNFSTLPAKFASAIDFAFHQYHLLDQKYRLPAYKMSQETAKLEVFGLEDLKGRLFGFIDHRWNHGPFVLTHTDLRWSNFIYRLFFDALKAATSRPCLQLANEWGRTLPTRVDLPLAVTLRHHSCFVNMYYRGIFPRFHNGSRHDVVKQFFERDGKNGQFALDIQRRLGDSERYTQYLEENGFISCQSPDKTSNPVSDTSIADSF